MTEMIFKVYDPGHLGTLKATLDPAAGTKIFGAKFRHAAKDNGSGSFFLQNDDTDIGNVAQGDLIRCVKSGTPVFEWLVKTKKRVSVDKAAAAGLPSGLKFTEISGVDTKQYGARSPIRPWRGGQSIPKETVRPFDWTSPLFDFSGWPAATQLVRADSIDPVASPHWIGSPQFLVDNEIYWIAGSDGTADDAPAGVDLFRAPRFTVVTYNKLTRIVGWCDNEGIFYLNGTEIMRCDTFHEARYIDLNLTPGTYDLAIFCRNENPTPTSSGNNPQGIGFGVYEVTADGTYVSRIMVSDSSCKVLAKPTTTPGLPLGQPIRLLLAENQARGEMVGYTLGFTDTHDSLGNLLPTATDVGALVKETFTEYLAALADAVIDVRVDPGLVIQIYYPKGAAAANVTGAGHAFRDGVSLKKLTHEEQDDRVTKLLIDYDGGYVEVGTGEFCKPLQLSQVTAEDAAIRIGTEVLAGRSTPSLRYAADIVTGTGREPYTDFKPGDSVPVDDPTGSTAQVPVVALIWTRDRAGKSVWAAEFGDLIEPLETIAARAVRRFAATRSATNIHSGQLVIKGGGGQVYHQEKLPFTYEPSDLQISQKVPAPVTRDIAYLEVLLDVADTASHTFTVKVNGATLTDLTTTVAAGATYARTWAPIPGDRIVAPTDKVTLDFSGDPIRFTADLVTR